MTTIKSRTTERTLEISPMSYGGTCLEIVDAGDIGRAIIVNRAELLAALGAVPSSDLADEMNRRIVAEQEFKGERRRVEEAEAESLEQARLVRTWADRAEKAERAEANWKLAFKNRDDEVTRLQGIVDAVIEWRDGEEQFDKLDAILNPPAFTLPTEAGARFEADLTQNGETRTFTTFVGWDTTIYSYEDPRYGWYTYDAEGVFDDFTNHRLIGPES